MPCGTGNLVCGPTFAARYVPNRLARADITGTRTVATHLPELPPVHEQQRAVWLVVRRLELEAEYGVRVAGDIELERRHEEPDARPTARQAR